MSTSSVLERVDAPTSKESTRWRLGIPFVLAHVGLLGLFFVGWSYIAVIAAVLSYSVRAFGITGFYHRCFSHRAFSVSRKVQFLGALAGAAAAQRGPLWWVAHHREHHRFTDEIGDPHSPVVDSFLYSHVLWIFRPENAPTKVALVPDLAVFPELRLIDRFEHVVPGAFAALVVVAGSVLGHLAPGLHTSGLQMLEWGFLLPTIVLYHSTFAVNSVAHRYGRRRFNTPDASRNNWFVSLLVFGEGWHNNHHRFPTSARQGIGRYEIDPTWWLIRGMRSLRLASALRGFPSSLPALRAQPSNLTREKS